jgi:DNA-binding CsgD family transcriptional regulator
MGIEKGLTASVDDAGRTRMASGQHFGTIRIRRQGARLRGDRCDGPLRQQRTTHSNLSFARNRGLKMLMPLQFGRLTIRTPGYPVSVFRPLIEASERGDNLLPIVESMTRGLGFDMFAQGVIMSPRPETETQVFLFSTHPRTWLETYDQRAYFEVDPRVQSALETTLPVIWDQSTFRGKSVASDKFLDVAMSHGVASGVAVPIRDRRGHAGMMSLSSKVHLCSDSRLSFVNQRLGDIVLFAECLHELFSAAILQRGIVPLSRGAPLSARECECLMLAGRGLTTEDIAERLHISSRTVQFHFDSIRAKLAAANRNEALAKAMQRGIISLS